MEIVRQEGGRKAHRRTLGGDAVQPLPQKPDFEPIEVRVGTLGGCCKKRND